MCSLNIEYYVNLVSCLYITTDITNMYSLNQQNFVFSFTRLTYEWWSKRFVTSSVTQKFDVRSFYICSKMPLYTISIMWVYVYMTTWNSLFSITKKSVPSRFWITMINNGNWPVHIICYDLRSSVTSACWCKRINCLKKSFRFF